MLLIAMTQSGRQPVAVPQTLKCTSQLGIVLESDL